MDSSGWRSRVDAQINLWLVENSRFKSQGDVVILLRDEGRDDPTRIDAYRAQRASERTEANAAREGVISGRRASRLLSGNARPPA